MGMKNWIQERNKKVALAKPNLKGYVTVGNTVKALQDGKIGGYLILWGSENEKDFDQQFFTKSTYLGHNSGNGADVVFNHRVPLIPPDADAKTVAALKSLAKRFMKNPLETYVDDIGVFGAVVAEMADEYEAMVYRLAESGKLKWSSATAPHLADFEKNGYIKSFPIIEGSLTPAPKEYRLIGHKVLPLKSFVDEIVKIALEQD